MKSPNPSTRKMSAPFLGALAIGTGLLAFTPDQASATITYDLRAISVDTPGSTVNGPKSVAGLQANSLVTFEIWAQITATTNTQPFGYQNGVFSVLSSDGGSLLGNVGLFLPVAPFNSGSSGGTITASLDADSDFDNGTNTTNTVTGLPKARSDNTGSGGGDPAFSNYQTTAVHDPALVFSPVTVGAESGFQFKLGTITFRATGPGPGNPAVPISINVRPPTNLNAGATRASGAAFLQNGVLLNGTTGTFALGADVSATMIPVPEPSAFGMVLLGAMGIVGLRRVGIRRA